MPGFGAHLAPYLERATAIEASRRTGDLDGRLARKVTDWIVRQVEAGRAATSG